MQAVIFGLKFTDLHISAFFHAAGAHCGGGSWQVVTCWTSEKHLPVNLCSAKAGETSFSRHLAVTLYSLFEQPSVVLFFLCPVSGILSQHRSNSIIKVSRIFALETFPYSTMLLFCTWGFPLSMNVGMYALQAFTFIFLLSEVLIFRFLRALFNLSFSSLLIFLILFLLCLSPLAIRVSTVAEMLLSHTSQGAWRLGNAICLTLLWASYLFVVLLLYVWWGKRMQWEKPLGATSWSCCNPLSRSFTPLVEIGKTDFSAFSCGFC